MIKSFFLLLLALPLLPACTGHHKHGTEPVVLDNGNRWQANPETTAGIADMQAILTKYESTTLDPTSRKSLREELEAEFEGIFKACTMKGEGHRQLHNYLMPIKEQIEKTDSKNPVESDSAVQQLKKQLADYQTYFQ